MVKCSLCGTQFLIKEEKEEPPSKNTPPIGFLASVFNLIGSQNDIKRGVWSSSDEQITSVPDTLISKTQGVKTTQKRNYR